MAVSEYRLARRVVAPLVAASLLAGVSLDAAATPGSNGVIRLQLGKTGVADRFVFENPAGTATGQSQRFAIERGTKCQVDLQGWLDETGTKGDPTLVKMWSTGPLGNDSVGLQSGSLGVYDNGKGVSCTRMTASIAETLVFETLVGGFDRLELDMETKGNAIFELIINPGSSGATTYTLRTGTSRTAGGWTGEASPGQPEVNCQGGSDSGPDSGPNDNCRWIINDTGGSFQLKPTAGEGSLEGGGDYAGMTGDFDTKIFLTSLIDVGSLGCTSTNNTTARVFADPQSAQAASCQVTRINPSNIGGSCTGEIDYRLETFRFESMCKLDKTGGVDDQLAGSIQITFEPEARVAWDGVARTEVTFTKPDGTDTAAFLAERCQGTRVNDANGNPTIQEVLSSTPPSWVVDQVPNNGYVDWACVLDNREVYLGDDEMQVTQTILYWGDIGWSRF